MIDKKCHQCGASFTSFACSNRKYCSRKCSTLAVTKPKESKNCQQCGKLFYRSRTVALRYWENTQYCSDKCRTNARHVPLADFKRICTQCGKMFFVKKPSVRGLFCSHKCHGDYQTGKHRIDISGEKHHNWRGGKTKEQEMVRKSIEYQEWRRQVFERDGYMCVVCGDDRGGNLEADHIKPFASHPELRFDVSNGRTLCHDCHTKTETYLNGSIRDSNTGRFVSNFI